MSMKRMKEEGGMRGIRREEIIKDMEVGKEGRDWGSKGEDPYF